MPSARRPSPTRPRFPLCKMGMEAFLFARPEAGERPGPREKTGRADGKSAGGFSEACRSSWERSMELGAAAPSLIRHVASGNGSANAWRTFGGTSTCVPGLFPPGELVLCLLFCLLKEDRALGTADDHSMDEHGYAYTLSAGLVYPAIRCWRPSWRPRASGIGAVPARGPVVDAWLRDNREHLGPAGSPSGNAEGVSEALV